MGETVKGGFWTTLPGVLTGVAALITAGTAAMVALRATPGHVSGAAAPVTTSTPQASHVPAAVAAPALPVASAESQRYRIDDPDGFTNLRAGPSADSPIVVRVTTSERFSVLERGGNWWRVRTAGGAEGYMHRSRIRPAVSGD